MPFLYIRQSYQKSHMYIEEQRPDSGYLDMNVGYKTIDKKNLFVNFLEWVPQVQEAQECALL